jgi:purine-binding chemotaxis protein CheW
MTVMVAALAARPEAASGVAEAWTGFELDGEAFALRYECVERVVTAGPVTTLPFAPAGIEGVVSIGGGVLPVVALRSLLFPERPASAMPGSGLVVIRVAGERFALRVNRVLFIADDLPSPAPEGEGPAPAAGESVADWHGRRVTCLTSERLGLDRLRPSLPPNGSPGMIADARVAAASVAAAQAEPVIAVASAGIVYGLPSANVAELLSDVTVTPLPLAPPLLLGVVVLRGEALLVVSLARLIGRDELGESGGYVVAKVGHRRFVLAVSEIIGLRRADAAHSPDQPLVLDLAAAIAPTILAVTVPACAAADAAPTELARGRRFLSFSVGDQLCAVPLSAVDRIHTPRSSIRLPKGMAPGIDGAIEIGGRVIPLTDGRRWLSLPERDRPPAAHVVLHHAGERRVLSVDAVHRVITIAEQDILSTGDADQPIAAVGRAGGRSVAILSMARLVTSGVTA